MASLEEENRRLEKTVLPTRRGLRRSKEGVNEDCSYRQRTRSAPSFICSACAVDLSKRDWKSAPPCSEAILMAAHQFIFARVEFSATIWNWAVPSFTASSWVKWTDKAALRIIEAKISLSLIASTRRTCV
jgi:hypothetical protein